MNMGIINSSNYVLYYRVCNVRGTFESDWEMSALVFPNGSYNCAEVLTLFINFKSIVLDVMSSFGEKLVSNLLAECVSEYW